MKIVRHGKKDWYPLGKVYFLEKGSGAHANSSCRQTISSICISLTSTIFLVGTSDGLIHLYDIPSHQLLRTISTHKGMSIAHLQTMIKPPDLIGHISLDFRVGTSLDFKDLIPIKPIVPFQRIRDAKSRAAHEVTTMLLPRHSVCSIPCISSSYVLIES